MADFFSGEIAEVKLADIDDFLALSRPEPERPPEGTRLDYNEVFPANIGDAVAALSNTDGGLIFVGVKANKLEPCRPYGCFSPSVIWPHPVSSPFSQGI